MQKYGGLLEEGVVRLDPAELLLWAGCGCLYEPYVPYAGVPSVTPVGAQDLLDRRVADHSARRCISSDQRSASASMIWSASSSGM